jgi:hypothetical protein
MSRLCAQRSTQRFCAQRTTQWRPIGDCGQEPCQEHDWHERAGPHDSGWSHVSKEEFDLRARALDAYRPPLAPADGAGCARVLQEFGVRAARCSREELWHAFMAGDDVPAEYVVGLHRTERDGGARARAHERTG